MTIIHDETATEEFLRRKARERELIDLHYPLLALEREREEALLDSETEKTVMPTRTRHVEDELTAEEKELAAHFGLTEEEAFVLRCREHGESLAQAAAKIKTSRGTTEGLDSDGLSASERHTQRLLGLSTRQVQTAKVESLRAERKRLAR